MSATEGQDPIAVQSVTTLDKEVENGDGEPVKVADLVADPETEWAGTRWPDEPKWDRPPRNPIEAYARAEAIAAFYRTMMRAPYSTRYRRKRRPLLTDDLIRRRQEYVCQRCGRAFERRDRGPRPRYCDECRTASRNAH